MDELFIFGIVVFLSVLLSWGFTHLTAERWQFMASVPVEKMENGLWVGFNLTYYGFFPPAPMCWPQLYCAFCWGRLPFPPAPC
ncbi:MAG: hypothetical protein R2875_09505 [Desulfobacterales bacterium]